MPKKIKTYPSLFPTKLVPQPRNEHVILVYLRLRDSTALFYQTCKQVIKIAWFEPRALGFCIRIQLEDPEGEGQQTSVYFVLNILPSQTFAQ